MWSGKGLVQVHVDDIETHVTRTDFAENCVQVGAVVIQQAARLVHHGRDLFDTTLKHPECRWVCEHDARRLRPDCRFERFEIDVAIGTCRHFFDDAAAHCCSRRVGTVCRIRADNFVTLMIIARIVIRLDHRHPGKLALCSGHRRKRHALHACNVFQHFLQLVHATQESLTMTNRTQWVASRETRQQCQRIACSRVVLHGAGTQRIKLRIDREVQLRQPCVVPHRLQFRCLWQTWLVGSQERIRNGDGHRVVRCLGKRPAARTRLVKYQLTHGSYSSIEIPRARNAAP